MAKKRGRPLGSGFKSDDIALEKIADKVVQTGVCFTQAYKELHEDTWTENSIRRVQKKWKVRQGMLVADAQRRLDAERHRRSVAASQSRVDPYARLNAVHEVTKKMAALSDIGAFGTLSEFARNAQVMINHPAVANARRLQERIAEATGFADLSAIDEVRRLQDVHALRALREQRKAFEALGL